MNKSFVWVISIFVYALIPAALCIKMSAAGGRQCSQHSTHLTQYVCVCETKTVYFPPSIRECGCDKLILYCENDDRTGDEI